MKTKRVNRYYCEFCKKSGGAKGHMAHHEVRCTLNPNRLCGMCGLIDNNQPDIKDLISLLPLPYDFYQSSMEFEGYSGLSEAIEKVMPELREKSGNCPACIMAALRQRGIPVPCAQSFNFTQECKEIWKDINEANTSNYGYGVY